jgi:hypothetical protein
MGESAGVTTAFVTDPLGFARTAFSNIRLRATGFHFEFPTVEQGLQ